MSKHILCIMFVSSNLVSLILVTYSNIAKIILTKILSVPFPISPNDTSITSTIVAHMKN